MPQFGQRLLLGKVMHQFAYRLEFCLQPLRIGAANLHQPQQLVGFNDQFFDFRQLAGDRAQTVLDVGERGVDLMRDAGNHLAQRRHFFGLDQLRFRFLQLMERIGQLAGALLYPGFQQPVANRQSRQQPAGEDQQRAGVGDQINPVTLAVDLGVGGFGTERIGETVDARTGGGHGDFLEQFVFSGFATEDLLHGFIHARQSGAQPCGHAAAGFAQIGREHFHVLAFALGRVRGVTHDMRKQQG